MENLENEIWKDIVGYEGLYQISNLGRVKSLERFSKIKNKNKEYCILKKESFLTPTNLNSYLKISLSKNCVRKTFLIHRLIAIHFIPNPYNKPQVNHIDHNKINNSISNLEWVTSMENICHAASKRNKTSKYIGVMWDKQSNKWRSEIKYNGKKLTLGKCFKTEEEAYEARKKFEFDNGIINKYI